MLKNILVCLLVVWLAHPAAAATIDIYEFDSDDDRRRYQKLMEGLRCPKCKNQSLAGTNSQIAVDLRRELHRMVIEGQSDAQIIDFMVSRYGEFVLYRPRLQRTTIALWAGPVVFLLLGIGAVGGVVYKRRRLVVDKTLSDAEQQRLAALLDSDSQTGNSSSAARK